MEASGNLSDVECRVLELLLQPNRSFHAGTADAIGEEAHMPAGDARSVLLGLERRRPPLVQRPGAAATTDENSWTPTAEAADAWREDCRS